MQVNANLSSRLELKDIAKALTDLRGAGLIKMRNGKYAVNIPPTDFELILNLLKNQ